MSDGEIMSILDELSTRNHEVWEDFEDETVPQGDLDDYGKIYDENMARAEQRLKRLIMYRVMGCLIDAENAMLGKDSVAGRKKLLETIEDYRIRLDVMDGWQK